MPDIDYMVHVSYLASLVKQYLLLSKSMRCEIAACLMQERSGILGQVDIRAFCTNNLAIRAPVPMRYTFRTSNENIEEFCVYRKI